MPSACIHSAAFSQRMPPVQKLTTVAPSSACRQSGDGARQLGEAVDRQAQGTGKGAVRDFLAVSRIEQDQPATAVVLAAARSSAPDRAAQPQRARPPKGVGMRPAEADDLGFDLDLESAERRARAVAALDPDFGEARIGPQSIRQTDSMPLSLPARNRLRPSLAIRIVPSSSAPAAASCRLSREGLRVVDLRRTGRRRY